MRYGGHSRGLKGEKARLVASVEEEGVKALTSDVTIFVPKQMVPFYEFRQLCSPACCMILQEMVLDLLNRVRFGRSSRNSGEDDICFRDGSE
jgi:hypothetical protein